MSRSWLPQWSGTCAVLASGESMSLEVAELVRSYSVRSIVVNNTFLLARWADMLYAADALWWKKYHAQTADFLGLKVCGEITPYPDVLRIKTRSGETGLDQDKNGFDEDPAYIRTGGNSGYSAIHLAVHAGCTRILLCGFDMKGGHWHERHTYPLREHGEGIFATWLLRLKTLAPELAKRGVEVIQTTPGSALTIWPYRPLEDALAGSVIIA